MNSHFHKLRGRGLTYHIFKAYKSTFLPPNPQSDSLCRSCQEMKCNWDPKSSNSVQNIPIYEVGSLQIPLNRILHKVIYLKMEKFYV